MSETRDEAIAAWARYFVRYPGSAARVVGFTFPGLEKHPVDAGLAAEIDAEVARSIECKTPKLGTVRDTD